MKQDIFQNILEKHFTHEEISMLPDCMTTSSGLENNLQGPQLYQIFCKKLGISPIVPPPTISTEKVHLSDAICSQFDVPSLHLRAISLAIEKLGGTRELVIGSESSFGPCLSDSAVSEVVKCSTGDYIKPKVLSIFGCFLGDNTLRAILEGPANRDLSILEALRIVSCGFKDGDDDQNGFSLFGQLLSLPSQLKSLKTLDLSGNIIRGTLSNLISLNLLSGALERLVLNNCDLDDMTNFNSALSSNKLLKELSVKDNPKVSLNPLLRSLALHPRMTHLDVSSGFKPRSPICEEYDSIVTILENSLSLQCLHITARKSEMLMNLHRGAHSSDLSLELKENLVISRAPEFPEYLNWQIGGEDDFEGRCWICERFKCHRFIFPSQDTRIESVDVIFDFTKKRFPLKYDKGTWQGNILLPPKKHQFAFSINKTNQLVTSSAAPNEIVSSLFMDCLKEVNWVDLKGDVNEDSPADSHSQDRSGQGTIDRILQSRQEAVTRCKQVEVEDINLRNICHFSEEVPIKQAVDDCWTILAEVFAIVSARKGSFPFLPQSAVEGVFSSVGLVLLDLNDPLSEHRGSLINADTGIGLLNGIPIIYRGTLTPSDIQMIVQEVNGESLTQTACASSRQKSEDAVTDIMSRQKAIIAEMHRIRTERMGETSHKPLDRKKFIEVVLRAAIFVSSKLSLTSKNEGGSTASVFRFICETLCKGTYIKYPRTHLPYEIIANSSVFETTLNRLIPESMERRSIFGAAFNRYGRSDDAFLRLVQLLKMQDRLFTAEDAKAVYALARIHTIDVPSRKLSYDEFIDAFIRLAAIHSQINESQHRRMARNSAVINTGEILAKNLETFHALFNAKIRASQNA